MKKKKDRMSKKRKAEMMRNTKCFCHAGKKPANLKLKSEVFFPSISKKKKEEMMLKGIAIFSMYLIISLTIVTAYSFRIENDMLRGFENVEVKKSLSEYAISMINFLIPSVSAQEACCVKTISGEYCKEGVSSENCAAGYFSGKCSDLSLTECRTGTCVQQNGDCDAQYTKGRCEERFGLWYPSSFLEVSACTPTCCVYTKENRIVEAKFTFFRNKCEKNPAVKEEGLEVHQEDISYKACQERVPPETKGYCTLREKAECKYSTKGRCDEQKGEFSSQRCSLCIQNYTKRDYTGEKGYGIYNFDSCDGPGDIVQACGIEELVEKNSTGGLNCVLKSCTLSVPFTNLKYDTAYLKAGKIEVDSGVQSAGFSSTLNQGQQACINLVGPGEQSYKVTCFLGELKVFGVDDQRKSVCAITGGLTIDRPNQYKECSKCGLRDYEKRGVGQSLMKALDFIGADLINPKWWDYWIVQPGLCTENQCNEVRNGYRDCMRTDHNDCVPMYPPANSEICEECMTTEASSPWSKCGDEKQCLSRGYCRHTENKYNFLASFSVCFIQTVMQAALGKIVEAIGKHFEWGDKIQKLIDKMKDKDKAKQGWLATIKSLFTKTKDETNLHFAGRAIWNALRTIVSAPFAAAGALISSTKGLEYIMNFFGGPSAALQQIDELEKDGEKINARIDKNPQKSEVSTEAGEGIAVGPTDTTATIGEKQYSYNYDTGKLTKDGERIDNPDADQMQIINLLKDYRDLTNTISQRDNLIKMLTKQRREAAAPAEKKTEVPAPSTQGMTYEQWKREYGDKYGLEYNSAERRVTIGKTEYHLSEGGTLVEIVGKTEVPYVRPSFLPTSFYDDTINFLKSQEKSLGTAPSATITTGAIFNPTGFAATEKELAEIRAGASNVRESTLRGAEYYGGLYNFPLREKGEDYKTNYKDAMDAWWEAQGRLGGFMANQLKAFGKGALIGLIIYYMGIGDILNMLSPQFWIKLGMCYLSSSFFTSYTAACAYAGVKAPLYVAICKKATPPPTGPLGCCACMTSTYIVPILLCSIQTAIRSEYLENNACVPEVPEKMPGIPVGYGECTKCQEDAFPCTVQRCQALSADASCAYDSYEQKCWPSPEKLKQCDKTSGTNIMITEVNNTAVPDQRYSKTNISYSDLSFDLELKTNIAAECRFSMNKTEGIDKMRKMPTDPAFKTHGASLDISDPSRKVFYYYALCQDTCRSQRFSKIVEIRLEKADKPDTEGPNIIYKYPFPDLPIEGSYTGKKDIVMTVKTDEASECKYKRWPIAESMESFVGSMEQIERVATTLIGAGASQETLESEMSLSGLSYDGPNMTFAGAPGEYKLQHNVSFTGKSALNNGEIYAYVFLCKDEKGNLGEIPGVIRFKVSQPFNVKINEPGDTMEPMPEILVSTEKNSVCGYSLENKRSYDNMTKFEKTGYTDHSTTVDKILSYGQHRLFVTCYDEEGVNIASDEKAFSVLRDNQAPQIVRAYYDAGTLFIATNELTSCQYALKQFNYGQGSEMTENTPVSKTHRMDWRPDTAYYIRCKDRFGNEMSSTLKTTKTAEVSAV